MQCRAIQKKREELAVAACEALLAAAKQSNGAFGGVDQATLKLSVIKIEACKRGPMP